MGRQWRVRKFFFLERLPYTCIYVGFVVYVEPQNMAILSDGYHE
jgi:hypothetical protein